MTNGDADLEPIDGMIFTDRFGYEWRRHEGFQMRDPEGFGWFAVDAGDGRARSLMEVITHRGLTDKGRPYLQARYELPGEQ